MAVAEIQEATSGAGVSDLLDSGVSAVTTAKAYRLLKAVLEHGRWMTG